MKTKKIRKNILIVSFLLFTQLTFGQSVIVSVKELSESGLKYVNKNVEVNCNKFESEGYTYIDLNGEPLLSKDVEEKMLKGISIGSPQIIKQETIIIIDEYDELKGCYLFGINEREFVDKYSFRDITMLGKIVDLGDGKNIGFKITGVKKRMTYENFKIENPYLWVIIMLFSGIFMIFLAVLTIGVIYGLLERYGIINPEEK
jgi:hypothetical protein